MTDDTWLPLLGLILLMLAFAVTIMFGIMVVFGGLSRAELWNRLVAAARHTYLEAGEPIPNVRPPLVARLVLRLADREVQLPRPLLGETAPQGTSTETRAVPRAADTR